jgi:2-methylcitrate dehydratase PrpD
MELSLKPYPSCRMTHGAIDAALALREAVALDIESIRGIEVRTSAMSARMVGKPFQIRGNPQVDAQFSIPYTMAVALIRGRPQLHDFTAREIIDPQVLALADKIVVAVSPEVPENDINRVSVTLVTGEGKKIEYSVSALKGSPQQPLTIDECREKFHDCVSFSGHETLRRRSEAIMDCILRLEEIEVLDELTRLL